MTESSRSLNIAPTRTKRLLRSTRNLWFQRKWLILGFAALLALAAVFRTTLALSPILALATGVITWLAVRPALQIKAQVEYQPPLADLPGLLLFRWRNRGFLDIFDVTVEAWLQVPSAVGAFDERDLRIKLSNAERSFSWPVDHAGRENWQISAARATGAWLDVRQTIDGATPQLAAANLRDLLAEPSNRLFMTLTATSSVFGIRRAVLTSFEGDFLSGAGSETRP